MRKINKQSPPDDFTNYKKKTNPEDPNYKPTFSGMDKGVKDNLRKSLLDEQGWICGYCQQKISSQSKCKIEHHCEQSICNGENGTQDKTLDYTNLLAVCYGDSGLKEKHCDSQKSDFSVADGLPIEVNPWITAHMNSISYHSSGVIKSSNQKHDREINVILNLNNKRLKSLRAKKYIFFIKNSGDISIRKGKDKLRRLLVNDLTIGDKKFSNAFPGMSEYMLKKFCD